MKNLDLTPSQQEKLARLESEISFDKITASFSIDARDAGGTKKGVLFSATVSKQVGGDRPGWTKAEAQFVSCLLSKHVVLATYRDAQAQKLFSASFAKQELATIFSNYDRHLANLVEKLEGSHEA